MENFEVNENKKPESFSKPNEQNNLNFDPLAGLSQEEMINKLKEDAIKVRNAYSDSDSDSDDEETKKKQEDEALKRELFASLPRHCTAYIPADINPKRRQPEPPRDTTPDDCFRICPKIISRGEWGADLPKKHSEQMMFRVRPAIFMETDGGNCKDRGDCEKVIVLMQRLQMDLLKFNDIAFSFLISEDGTIFEGRGWGYENEKARGFSGIGYIGYFSLEPLEEPSDAMLQATYDLIMCGVRKGFLYNPFATGAFDGETPIELIKELLKHKEDVDYRTRPEDLGIDSDYEMMQ